MSRTTHEAEYDEDRGGPRNEHNYLSFPGDGALVKATRGVLPWAPVGTHDPDPTRMIIPSAFVENLFRKAPTEDPHELREHHIVTKCLSLTNYIAPALDILIEEHLLETGEKEGDVVTYVPKIFDSYDDLIHAADQLVTELDCWPPGEKSRGA